MKIRVCSVFAAVFAVAFCGVSLGSVITNANDVSVNVELGSSWVGGVAPGAADTAVFNGVNTSTRFKAGTDISWYGMEWRNPGNLGQAGMGISGATGSETLTLGAGGMLFVPLAGGTGPRVYFDMPVVVDAAQTWKIMRNMAVNEWTGKVYPRFTRPVSVNADLAVKVEYGNIVVVQEPITVANGAKITISDGGFPAVLLTENARVAGALEVVAGTGFCLAPTNSATVHFSDLLSSFTNNGYFCLGGYEDYRSGHVLKVLFGQDDLLTTTATSMDRSASSLRIFDANVVMDGGSARTRWFRLHNGRWTNVSGDTWFDYQNIIGCGTNDDKRVAKEAVFDMQGGTYKFRRIAVGVGNDDRFPAQFVVSGGTATSDLLAPNVASQKWYSGLDIAVCMLDGEWAGVDSGKKFDSEYAAGDVLVSGNGTLSVPRISFGGNTSLASGACVTNGAGRLRMTGGEIKMGTVGFRLGDLWGDTGKSWYDVTFSGGRLSTLYSGARQMLKVRLSDADGGVTYDIGSGHTYTVESPMFGSGGLVKTGAGTMVLESGNDYAGRTVVSNGSLLVRSSAAASGVAYTAAGVSCPDATMRLVADDIDAVSGASVSSWTAHSGSSPATVFSQGTAANVLTSPTAPVVTMSGFNGHKAVSFDGESAALASGGADAPWVSSGNNGSTAGFTVAMVVRFDGRGEGTSQWAWWVSRPFFGPTKTGYGNAYVWNMALTGAGQLQGGSVWAKKDSSRMDDWSNIATGRPAPRWLDDGRPHVVVMTLPTYNDNDGKVTMTVDGYRSETAASWKATTLGYGRSYMILGASDLFKEQKYTACSVAEIRFWRGTQLTEAEIKAFSEEMSATYGVELDGYTTFGVSGQHSREIAVSSGATYGTDSNGFTLPLYAGQTLSGAGSVVGNMSAQTNSTILLSSSGSPSFGSDLTLEDGAVVKVADNEAAAASVSGSLAVGAGDVVTVDISGLTGDVRRGIDLFTFGSGTVAAENFRLSPADGRHSIRVRNGKVRLNGNLGFTLVFR